MTTASQTRSLTAFVAAILVVASSLPAPAQVRRIQGKVIDSEGTPVADAAIEGRVASLADADFAVRNNDQVFRTRTNADGTYILTMPLARSYLVTATKDGVGSDHVTVPSQQSGLITANLTLWKRPTPPPASAKCSTRTPSNSFDRNRLTAAAEPGLVRLFTWLDAVHLHMPGCAGSLMDEVSRWSRRDLEVLLRDVAEVVKFLERVQESRGEFQGRMSVPRGGLILTVYNRDVTIDSIERVFFDGRRLGANDLLRRAAVFHADIAVLMPGDFGRYPLVEDGGGRGWRRRSSHWEMGRLLLDFIKPSPSDDSDALLWYRAVSALLFRTGNLAELPSHLSHARRVFPHNAAILVESGYLHHELSSPAIQASVQDLRSNNASVGVGSRRSELQRAEQFFRAAVEIEPEHVDARVRFGHVLGELGRHTEAAAELRKAIDGKPDRIHLYLAFMLLGRTEAALGRRDAAKQQFEQAVALYPDAQSPRLALSGLARQSGERASARQLLQRISATSSRQSEDPWWDFYHPHKHDAAALVARMRNIGRGQ